MRVTDCSKECNDYTMPALKDLMKGKLKPKSSTSTESSEFFRGSSDIDLAPQGVKEAEDVAERNKDKFTSISSSPLRRAKDTAEIISKTNPDAGKVKIEEALEPWFLGNHEGKEVTQARLDELMDKIKNNPDDKLEGRGEKSTGDGESFNDFKNPTLDYVKKQIADHKQGESPLNLTHYRVVHLVRAWLRGGAKDDNSIDIPFMVSKGDEKPGNLFKLDPKDMSDLKEVEKADGDSIYFGRHGATEWNEENKGGPSPNSGTSKGSIHRLMSRR